MLVVDMFDLNSISIKCKYAKDYVFRLKQIPYARFDKYYGVWIIPYNSLQKFEEVFKGEIVWKTPEWVVKSLPMPDMKAMYKFDNNIVLPNFKIKPYDYQEFGMKFMIDRLINKGFSLCCDSVGLGKTPTAIGCMKYMHNNCSVDKILILGKKSIKRQWKQEIIRFSDLDTDMLIEYIPEDATAKQREKIYNKCIQNGKYILITTYQSCLHDKKFYKQMDFDMMIIDEGHLAVGPKISKAIVESAGNAKYKIFLTGTPLMTKPVDMYKLVSIADKNYFGKWKDFQDRYVTYEWQGRFNKEIGYRNLDELRGKVQDILIRRTEQEVTLSLPQIIEKRIDVDKDNVQINIINAINQKKAEYQGQIMSIRNKLDTIPLGDSRRNAMEQQLYNVEAALKGIYTCDQAIADDPRLFLMSISQNIRDTFGILMPQTYAGSPKTEAILDQIEEILDKGEKMVLFSEYVRYVELLKQDIERKFNIKVLTYHGQKPGEENNDAVDLFTQDKIYEYPILIGTNSLSEGVNLQIANNQFNCDLPHSPAIKTQRMGRIRRASSTHSHGYTYDFITEDSEDTVRIAKLERASNLFDAVVGVNEAQSAALKELMNK